MEGKALGTGLKNRRARRVEQLRSWGGGRKAEPGDKKYLPGPGATCLGKFSS